MKKPIIFAGLIAVLAAFWASANPDGLDKVSESLGFAARVIERHSLMTDYALPFLPAGPVSTAAAGMIGILIVFGLVSGLRFFFRAHDS
jgi:hypothetical protein